MIERENHDINMLMSLAIPEGRHKTRKSKGIGAKRKSNAPIEKQYEFFEQVNRKQGLSSLRTFVPLLTKPAPADVVAIHSTEVERAA